MLPRNFPHPQSTATIAGYPIHAMLVPFPIVCFVLALVTDIVYWQTSNLMWAEFSAWLLLAGIAFGVLAAVFGAVDFLASSEIREQRPAWPHAVGNVIVLIWPASTTLYMRTTAGPVLCPGG